MQGRICAVIVTYNRKELLLRNIKTIMNQSISTDIIIIDNHSTDETEMYLKEKGILEQEKVCYLYLDYNSGGAGGFCKGLEVAVSKNYDYMWLMDDDGYCYNNQTLEELIRCIPTNNTPFIINSTVICDEKKTLTFGFLDISTYEQLINKSIDGIYNGYINPFNSTLISKECINKIGFPKKEFFIYGDEHEYMLRALKNKIYVGTIINSLYYHPVNRKIEKKVIGRYEIPIKNEPVWKTFCEVRNNTYIMKHYYGKKMLLINTYISLLSAICRKERMKYLKYTILGLHDGIIEYFDRPIMFDK